MAVQYTYKCLNCDFNIMTNEEGCDCNTCAISHKYICKTCHEIFSLARPLSFRKSLEEDSKKLGHYLDCEVLYGIEVTDTCPLCGAKDCLSRWSPKDGCPKCGSQVMRDPRGVMMLTD